MRPKERKDSSAADLFRSRLDQIVDMNHSLAKLSRLIDWKFLEEELGSVYRDVPGRPPLPTRLMAGLAIHKYMHDLSDVALCERWVKNPYYQLFCGEEFFQCPGSAPVGHAEVMNWREDNPTLCKRRILKGSAILSSFRRILILRQLLTQALSALES